MAKNNQKCVRMSDDVLNVVEKINGDGFNDKFEKLVIAFDKTIPEREKLMKYYDDKIQEKMKELKKVEQRISSLNNFEFNLNNLRDNVLRIQCLANDIPSIVSQ